MTRTIRRFVQIGFLLFFLYLFFQTEYPLTLKIPPDLFLRFSPLLTAVTSLAARTLSAAIFPALLLLLLTLLLGRAFCGWACPMGTVIDIWDFLFYRRRKTSRKVAKHPWKYYILTALVVSAIFSTQAVYFLDPLSLLTRTTTTAIYPVLQAGRNEFARHLGPSLRQLTRGGIEGSDSQNPSPIRWVRSQFQRIAYPVEEFSFRANFTAAVIFLVILLLGAYHRRFWCHSLCPLGALLALFSPPSLLRPKATHDCDSCGKCVQECKMSALITEREAKLTECIFCFDCVRDCPREAMKIKFSLPQRPIKGELDLSRRRVLQSLAIGAFFALIIRTEFAQKYRSPYSIRPPGAIPEQLFLEMCVRCGECMKVCPTNGLQPAFAEAGIRGLWTPILIPRVGYCERNCNLCGQVCSTGAITNFEPEEKENIRIGLATIDRDRCIAWYADQLCLICAECCSYKAIILKEVDGLSRPFVDEPKCPGCGECEKFCPVGPERAIVVTAQMDQESRRERLVHRKVRRFPGLGK